MSSVWRDDTGRALEDHPRPSLAVDVVLLTVVDDGVRAVVHRRGDGYARGRFSLPGTFVHVDETLADAALRALADILGVTGRRPEQLRVFDALDRDERGRVLSVAHVDVVPPDLLDVALEQTSARLVAAGATGGAGRPLAFDHETMVDTAVAHLRAEHTAAPDPRRLLGTEFTVAELHHLHEVVAGAPLGKDTFRRQVLDALEPTGDLRSGTVGKPARLFRHRSG